MTPPAAMSKVGGVDETEPIDRPGRRRRRWGLKVGATVAALGVAAGIAPWVSSSSSAADPGDPLGGFGTGGTLTVSLASDCGARCPVAGSGVVRSALRRAPDRTIIAAEWDGTTEADTGHVGGIAAAVHLSGGAAQWTRHLDAPVGHHLRLLDAGWRPATAEVLVAVAVERDADGTQVHQEVRALGQAGAPASTATFAAGTEGTWTDAAFGPDGSLAVVADTASTRADELPTMVARRYGPDLVPQWTTALPVGDAVEDIEIGESGTVLLAGSHAPGVAAEYDGLVARLTADGALDAGFDGDGRIVTAAAPGLGRSFVDVDDSGTALAAVGIDQFEVPEVVSDDEEPPGASVVLRVQAGAPDATFGPDGLRVDPAGPDGSGLRVPSSVLIDGRQVVVAGGADTGGAMPTPWMTRLGATGAIDPDFEVTTTEGLAFTGLVAIPGGYAATPQVASGSELAVAVRAFQGGGALTAPAAPVLAKQTGGYLRVGWSPVPGASGYDVVVDRNLDGTVDATYASATSPLLMTKVAGGTVARFAVVAKGSGLTSSRSGWSAPTVTPFTSLDSFTNRQFLDVVNRAATTAEKLWWRTALRDGRAPAALADGLVGSSSWQGIRSPLLRVYRAVLLRDPTTSSLATWASRRKAGLSLDAVAKAYLATPEAKLRYGRLTNRQFVDRLYRQLRGRPATANELRTWATPLDRRRKTRSQVVVALAESTWNVARSRPRVDTINVYTAMLRRMPTSSAISAWDVRFRSGATRATVVESVLRSSEYARRAS